MEFGLSEQQKMFRQTAREFALSEIYGGVNEIQRIIAAAELLR
jgi:alkylation response protein AidB-like acyl-CoA dehydrogenase